MKTIESETKPAMFARLRNSKGFSLIEMAIVLIIIGIIIAAIIKGQDLLFNARGKQLISTANAWKLGVYTYMDRNGRFPGDNGKNGVIGDVAGEQSAAHTAIYEIASTLGQAPANPIQVGGQSYWYYLGYAANTATVATATSVRNAMIICTNAACSATFSDDDVAMFTMLDNSLDGSVAPHAGQFRALTATPSGVFTAVATSQGLIGRDDAAVGVNTTADVEGTLTVWTAGATGHMGAVWAFDKPF
jgi:prepilin-type N-terminal cleavage/methylation domain-containing protein